METTSSAVINGTPINGAHINGSTHETPKRKPARCITYIHLTHKEHRKALCLAEDARLDIQELTILAVARYMQEVQLSARFADVPPHPERTALRVVRVVLGERLRGRIEDAELMPGAFATIALRHLLATIACDMETTGHVSMSTQVARDIQREVDWCGEDALALEDGC
jgi:hypothetical protein